MTPEHLQKQLADSPSATVSSHKWEVAWSTPGLSIVSTQNINISLNEPQPPIQSEDNYADSVSPCWTPFIDELLLPVPRLFPRVFSLFFLFVRMLFTKNIEPPFYPCIKKRFSKFHQTETESKSRRYKWRSAERDVISRTCEWNFIRGQMTPKQKTQTALRSSPSSPNVVVLPTVWNRENRKPQKMELFCKHWDDEKQWIHGWSCDLQDVLNVLCDPVSQQPWASESTTSTKLSL